MLRKLISYLRSFRRNTDVKAHVFKYLDASTAHLTEKEMSEIEQSGAIVRDHPYGAWVHVPAPSPSGRNDEIWTDYRKRLATNFPNLLALCELARSLGCFWINLDCDADTIDGLQTFEW